MKYLCPRGNAFKKILKCTIFRRKIVNFLKHGKIPRSGILVTIARKCIKKYVHFSILGKKWNIHIQNQNCHAYFFALISKVLILACFKSFEKLQQEMTWQLILNFWTWFECLCKDFMQFNHLVFKVGSIYTWKFFPCF